MKETTLCTDLAGTASDIQRIDPLDAGDLRALVHRFVRRFVADATATWWWTALRDGVQATVIEYGEQDAWTVVPDLLPERSEYVLLVTNEDPNPRCAFVGTSLAICELVAESPFFEYVVTDRGGSFGVFDTHHNSLVAVGT